MGYGDCYTLEEAEDVMDRYLDRIDDLEHQLSAYSDEIDTLELRLIACQKELTNMQSQDDPMPCGHPTWALEHDEEGTGYCAWCEDIARIKEQRDNLLAACEAVKPTLYGMLIERWGHPDNWPEWAQGAVVYQKLKTAITKTKSVSPDGETRE